MEDTPPPGRARVTDMPPHGRAAGISRMLVLLFAVASGAAWQPVLRPATAGRHRADLRVGQGLAGLLVTATRSATPSGSCSSCARDVRNAATWCR